MTQQEHLGLTIQQTPPLHHILEQQRMNLADQLYARIMQLEQNERAFLAFLAQLKSGVVNLEQVKVTDKGFEVLAPPPKAGSDNGTKAEERAGAHVGP